MAGKLSTPKKVGKIKATKQRLSKFKGNLMAPPEVNPSGATQESSQVPPVSPQSYVPPQIPSAPETPLSAHSEQPSLPTEQAEDYSSRRGVRLNHIRGVDKYSTEFFSEFIKRSDNMRRGDTLIDVLINASKVTNYAPPLAAVALLKKGAMEEAQKRLASCPVKGDGQWMTVEEITALGFECSKEAITGIMREEPQKFPSMEFGKGKNTTQKYWIGSRNIGHLEKKGRSLKGWATALEDYSRAESEYEQLRDSLEKILKRPLLEDSSSSSAVSDASPSGNSEEGIRMTTAQIKAAGSTYNPFYLATLLRKNAGIFSTRRKSGKGRAVEALITKENYAKAGLDHYPGDKDYVVPQVSPATDSASGKTLETKVDKLAQLPQEQKEPPRSFEIYGERVVVKPSDSYSTIYVRAILKKVHPAAFTDLALTEFFNRYKKENGEIPGTNLIEVLEKTVGMLIDSATTRKRLESTLGIDELALRNLLANPEVQQRFVHTLPGLVDSPYLLNSELNELKNYARRNCLSNDVASLQNSLGNGGSFRPLIQQNQVPIRKPLTPELVNSLKKYNSVLQGSGILPPNKAYESLLHLGILQQDSEESMNRTYSNFIETMDGWEFKDLSAVSRQYDLTWQEFSRRFIPELIARKLVRNLAKNAPHDGPPLYVVAKDKLNEIRTTVNQLDHRRVGPPGTY